MTTNSKRPKVAVLGATGLVGQNILMLLIDRNFPAESIKLLASSRSAGQDIEYNGHKMQIELATPEAFEGVDLVLSSAGGAISEKLVPEAVKRGAVVIDNTSFYRMNDNVPLVVAGVNDEDCKNHHGIIANPNCSTAQLMPALKVLDDVAGLKRVIVSTYQSASGAGQKGIIALQEETHALFHHNHDHGDHDHSADDHDCNSHSSAGVFNRSLAFNVVPHIDKFDDNGYTKEENKLINETKKILHKPDLLVTATAVRVPVIVGHSESVTVELEKSLSPEAAIDAWGNNDLIEVYEDPNDYPTPEDCVGEEPVLIGRVRRDTSNPETGLNFWIVADNLMIGAALNAVRIAEYLQANDLIHASKSPVGV